MQKKKKNRIAPDSAQLGPSLARYGRRLNEGGYSESTTSQYLSICHKFSEYIAREGIDPCSLAEAHLDAFLVEASKGRQLRDGGSRMRLLWRIPILQFFEEMRRA